MLDALHAFADSTRSPFDARRFAFHDTGLWRKMVLDEAPSALRS
jgi:hypothetical protein